MDNNLQKTEVKENTKEDNKLITKEEEFVLIEKCKKEEEESSGQ